AVDDDDLIGRPVLRQALLQQPRNSARFIPDGEHYRDRRGAGRFEGFLGSRQRLSHQRRARLWRFVAAPPAEPVSPRSPYRLTGAIRGRLPFAWTAAGPRWPTSAGPAAASRTCAAPARGRRRPVAGARQHRRPAPPPPPRSSEAHQRAARARRPGRPVLRRRSSSTPPPGPWTWPPAA